MSWGRRWLPGSLIRSSLLFIIVAAISAATIFLLLPRVPISDELISSPLVVVLGPALLAALITIFADWVEALSKRDRWRKAHIQELGEKHYRRMVADVAEYAIYMLDPEGNIISWNEGAAHIKGYREDEILGAHFSIFYASEDVEAGLPSDNLQTALRDGRLRTEGWRIRKDGSRFRADILVVPVEDESGALLGFTKITRDITRWHETTKALALSEERLSEAQRIANIGSWEYDIDAEVLVWSDQLYRIHGFEPGSFTPTTDRFFELVHPEDQERLLHVIQDAFANREDYALTHRIIQPGGTERILRAIGRIEVNDLGKPVRMLGINEDITERLELEQEFELQTQLYESIVNAQSALGQGVLLIEEHSILYANEALEEILNLPVSKIEDTSALIDALDLEASSPLTMVIQNNVEEPHSNIFGRATLENEHVAHLEYAATTIGVDGHHYAIILLRDITRNVQFENDLQQSRDKLRKTYAELNRAVEAERARISREIHDELGQQLTGLKMDLSWLASKLNEKTESMSALVDSTVQDVRRLATELRPGILDDLGLLAAIEWQVGEFEERTGIECSLHAEQYLRVENEEIATAMFRIFQEALTNITRHADANTVNVVLQRHDHTIKLTVEDDGRGVSDDTLHGDNISSLGLLGMRERAEILGGKTMILPGATRGTIVEVELPITPSGSEPQDAD